MPNSSKLDVRIEENLKGFGNEQIRMQAKTSFKNLEILDAYKQQTELEKRSLVLESQKSVKWNKFRLQRKEAIEKYCDIRRV